MKLSQIGLLAGMLALYIFLTGCAGTNIKRNVTAGACYAIVAAGDPTMGFASRLLKTTICDSAAKIVDKTTDALDDAGAQQQQQDKGE